MSDIRIYTAANMPDSPLTGDVVICSEAFNLAPANSVHLCTNATGPVWKSFANDAEVLSDLAALVYDTDAEIFALTDVPQYTLVTSKESGNSYVWDGSNWVTFNQN